MKLGAVPAEVSLRSSIPITIVHNHTVTPVGTSAAGRCQPRDSSQPAAVPTRNGQAVSAIPETVSPSAWLRRPIVQNTITKSTSVASAVNAGRVRSVLSTGIGHHIENQWADILFVACGKTGL